MYYVLLDLWTWKPQKLLQYRDENGQDKNRRFWAEIRDFSLIWGKNGVDFKKIITCFNAKSAIFRGSAIKSHPCPIRLKPVVCTEQHFRIFCYCLINDRNG